MRMHEVSTCFRLPAALNAHLPLGDVNKQAASACGEQPLWDNESGREQGNSAQELSRGSRAQGALFMSLLTIAAEVSALMLLCKNKVGWVQML